MKSKTIIFNLIMSNLKENISNFNDLTLRYSLRNSNWNRKSPIKPLSNLETIVYKFWEIWNTTLSFFLISLFYFIPLISQKCCYWKNVFVQYYTINVQNVSHHHLLLVQFISICSKCYKMINLTDFEIATSQIKMMRSCRKVQHAGIVQ